MRWKPVLDPAQLCDAASVIISAQKHRNRSGERLFVHLFFLHLTPPLSPSTAVLFPVVLKISRFVSNVKYYPGFFSSLGADYSTSKLISPSRSFALSYFHTINFSVAAWTNPSHPFCVQPLDIRKWPWLSRTQGFYNGISILLTMMQCKLAQMYNPFLLWFIPCTKFANITFTCFLENLLVFLFS